MASVARMTSTLTEFLSRLCGKFQVAVPGAGEGDRVFVMRLLAGYEGDTDAILTLLREHPQVCVLALRVEKDKEKQEYVATHN